MKYAKRLLTLLLAGMLLLPIPAVTGAGAQEADAVAWLRLFFDGQLEEADARLDDGMRGVLEAQGGLPAVLGAMKTYGEVTRFGEPVSTGSGGYLVVTVPITFEKEQLNAEISLDQEGLVAGLYFSPGASDKEVALATGILDALMAGDYEAVDAALSPEMRAAMEAAGGMQAQMEGILESLGAMVEIGTAAKAESQGFQVVTLPVAFEGGSMHMVVSIDAQGQVAGLSFQPPVTIEEAVVPEGMTETEVTVDAGTGYPLGGTLCVPDGAVGGLPAILLVAGSGQHARDEIVGANRVFAQLAHGLAERGIITLRVDKRTFAYPEVWDAPGFTVKEEYIEDVLAALEVLRGAGGVDASRVYIAGHSQGAMLAPRFMDEGAEAAGLILMAGTTRSLTDLVYDQQMNALGVSPGQAVDEALAPLVQRLNLWDEEAAALYAMTGEEALAHAPLYDGAFPAYYLYEMQQFDGLAFLESQEMPLLIQQGGKDMQVYAGVDYPLYVEALEGRDDVQFRLYDGLNHIFMPSEAKDINEAIAEYYVQGRIPEEVLDDIAAFVGAE